MAHRFAIPDSSPAPSTPAKGSRSGAGFSFADNEPSTTPAGPPPSSAASFTPAGAPSASFLGSSVMQTVTGNKQPTFSSQSSSSRGGKLFDRSERSYTGTGTAPLGRSIRGAGRKPSGLSHQFSMGDGDEEEEDEDEDEDEGEGEVEDEYGEPDDDEDEDAEGEDEWPVEHGSLFRTSAKSQKRQQAGGVEDAMEAEIAKFLEQEAESEADDEDMIDDQQVGSDPGDMFLNMRHDDRPYGRPVIGEGEDLMLLQTPNATERVRKEAEDIFRRSSARFGNSLKSREFQFATIAKDLYTQQDVARITEPPELVLKTEDLVCRLYDEGVGAEEDAEKLDNSLASITYRVCLLWNEYVDELPPPEGEDVLTVGPTPKDDPFEKAAYLAHLILRMHHTRFVNEEQEEKTPPLPEVLFEWMDTSHNPYPDQLREISQYKPSPACHSLYWQTLRNALLRGNVTGAVQLLRDAGWEHVRRGTRGDKAYTGKSLENVRRFADEIIMALSKCPAVRGEWDIGNSHWQLFRIQAKGSLDQMTLFAEGRDQQYDDDDTASDGQASMSKMARRASSRLPWDVYENLQTVYGIILGQPEAIMETAQDWCEATVALLAWWEGSNMRMVRNPRASQSRLRASVSTTAAENDDFNDRLATVFHLVIESDLSPNTMNPVEVAIASAFEGDVNSVIGFLRTWSLPVACSVAEIASLGGWLPEPEVSMPLPTDSLDMDDLALLGLAQPGADEMEGIKDHTLVLYARELAGLENLAPNRSGWELAIQVLGRMDLPEKSEETVGELLRDLLATLDESSSSIVDKIWRILNDLGMINFAEETAETFADILSKESHRYGEALWYYALSHRTDKVREVLNLLISYSLVQSTVFPAEKDLDEDLKNLLRNRSDALEARAKQDLEAAQLLGRMLSGYATLRKFYELRDQQKTDKMSSAKAVMVKNQAAFALVAVISSSDDNIRGGLYDESRDAVVSEDFLLALLGEASVFVDQSPSVITLDQIDVLLKAIEDIETVGSRVYDACDGFFNLVLSSAQGLKGASSQEALDKSTNSLSGSSYVMTGSSMLLASQLQQSISSGTAAGAKLQRGWDWRQNWAANTKAKDVLRKLRLGLAKDLAALWMQDADSVATY